MEQLNEISTLALPFVISIVKAVLFLAIGVFIANRLATMVRKTLARKESIDETLAGFFSTLVRWVLLAFVVMAVLNVFGIETTSLVAVLGAASLAVGLALQGTLSDFAAGVMLLIFRPFKAGDYVQTAGTAGTVTEINLCNTVLLTPDNVRIIAPNSSCWGNVVTNFSAMDTRRVDLVFGVDYATDINQAKDIIMELAKADSRTLSDPEPWVRLTNLGDSSLDITARVWCKSEDYWDLKFSLTQAVKEAFDEKNIDIPYPHQIMITK